MRKPMRKTELLIWLLLAPAAAWSQNSSGGYTPTTPAGSYISGGIGLINDLLHPPPPSITSPPYWGKFSCKFAEGKYQLVYTTYMIQITPPFKINTIEKDQPSGKECDPSDKGNGQPLTNSDSEAVFRPTLGGLPPQQTTHLRAEAVLPIPGPDRTTYTAPVLALPFPPVYSATQQVTAAQCNPNNAPEVFMVNHSSDTVTRVNSCSFQILATIRVTSRPLQVAITPDGTLAVVTSFDNAISFISTATNTVVSTIKTDFTTNPSGIAISPDGTRAYVTSFTIPGSSVLIVDIQQGQILSKISLDEYPQSIFLSPDGAVAYVTFPFGTQVRLIDTLTGTVFGAIPAGQTYGVAFNSTGTTAYITSQQSKAVIVVNTADFSIAQTIPLPLVPDEIKITPDDQWLLINSYDGKSQIIVNPATGQVDIQATSGPPHGLVIVQ